MNVTKMMNHLYLDQRSTVGLCISIAVILCYSLIYTLWRWHSDWTLVHQPAITTMRLLSTPQTADLVAAIPKEHLFGNALLKTGAVPTTNLQLRVTGIIKAEPEQSGVPSKATISISGQPSKAYQVGDSLPDGVKVYEITGDAVILENNGRLEKLPLPREKLEFRGVPAMQRSVYP